MIAAIVAPAGVRSIAMMRACLVAGRAADFDDAGVGRLRDLDLLDFGEAERVAALAVDLGLVMGSSEVHATPSAAPPQPRPGKTPAGQDPRSAHSPLQSRHSNAPIESVSQSNLSKIVALSTAIMPCMRSVRIAIPAGAVLLLSAPAGQSA